MKVCFYYSSHNRLFFSSMLLAGLIFMDICLGFESRYSSRSRGYTISGQFLSFASNAGGQNAYALRLAQDDTYEYSLFANQYLMVGSLPLLGGVVSKRVPWCPRTCFLRSFVQIGLGVSNGGALVELVWSFNPLWIFRIDFTTHFYASQSNTLMWSYPLWLGVSLPF